VGPEVQVVSQQGFAPAQGGYEFDARESSTIEKIGSRTRTWGIISLVMAIAGTIGLLAMVVFAEAMKDQIPAALVHGLIGLMVPVMVVHFAIAALYIGSGSALLRVVHTQGNDVEHLLVGISKMGTAFKVEFIVTIVAMFVGAGVAFTFLAAL
jgi:hypothetical protein